MSTAKFGLAIFSPSPATGQITLDRHFSSRTLRCYGSDLRQILEILVELQEPGFVVDNERESSAFAARAAWAQSGAAGEPPTSPGTIIDAFFSLTSDRVNQILDALEGRGFTPNTVGRKLAALRSAWRIFRKAKLVKGDPFASSRKIKRTPPIIKLVDPGLWLILNETPWPEVVRAVSGQSDQASLAAALRLRDLALVTLFLFEGVKSGDLVAMDEGSFVIGSGRDPATLTVTQGMHKRTIPLRPRTAEALSTYIAALQGSAPQSAPAGTIVRKNVERPLFANKHRGDLSSRSMRRKISAVLKRLEQKAVSPAALRHTAIVHALGDGMDERDACKRFGFYSASSLVKYRPLVQTWQQQLREARTARSSLAPRTEPKPARPPVPSATASALTSRSVPPTPAIVPAKPPDGGRHGYGRATPIPRDAPTGMSTTS